MVSVKLVSKSHFKTSVFRYDEYVLDYLIEWFIMLIVLRRRFYCVLIFFVMSIELWSPRWAEIPGSFAFLYSSSVIHLSFLTLLVSWEASLIPQSPEYFISFIFRWRYSTHRYLQRLEMARIPLKIVNIYPYLSFFYQLSHYIYWHLLSWHWITNDPLLFVNKRHLCLCLISIQVSAFIAV